MNLFSEIKSRVSIEEILEVYGIKTEKNGFILCPFHAEKTPSAKIHGNYFHCFGCGITLDIFSFVSRIENIKLYEALRKIDSIFSLNLAEKNNFNDFDRLIHTIRKKEAELSKMKDYAIIGKEKRNTIMKKETELKILKKKLFSEYSNDIDNYFKGMEARLCNMKSLQRSN